MKPVFPNYVHLKESRVKELCVNEAPAYHVGTRAVDMEHLDPEDEAVLIELLLRWNKQVNVFDGIAISDQSFEMRENAQDGSLETPLRASSQKKRHPPCAAWFHAKRVPLDGSSAFVTSNECRRCQSRSFFFTILRTIQSARTSTRIDADVRNM